MKTPLLFCLATLLAGTLCAQTPARKPTTAARKTAPAARQATSAKPSAVSSVRPTPANVVQPSVPAPAPAQASPPAETRRTQPAPTTAPTSRQTRTSPAASQKVARPVAAESQSGGSSMQFGIVAGGTLASQSLTVPEAAATSPTRMGFHAGVLVDIPLSSHLSVQPSLLYMMKGSGESTDKLSDFDDLSLSYVELPLTVFYRIPVGTNSLRVGLGGYAAYGLSGRSTSAGQSRPVEFGSGENQANPLDFGPRGAVQFQMGNILLGASYDYGLGNHYNTTGSDKITLTNRAISVSVGYMLGGSR